MLAKGLAPMPLSEPVLRVENLVTEFSTSNGPLRAVDGVSFEVHRGETLCIVGESGSGKSTTMLSALGLIPKAVGGAVGGKVHFQGQDLLTMRAEKLRDIRGNRIGMIFQDPMSSLNPVYRVGEQLVEAILLHRGHTRPDARRRAIEVLELVGVPDAPVRVNQYPHEYSGGMRQRAMIAMAIINDPALLVADEPTTALDVTIQAQVLRVLGKAQLETGSATILITHDLGVVAETADRVLVMYGGRIIEQGDVATIFRNPKHPYTAGLLASQPRIDASDGPLTPIPGDPPSLADLPSGCVFRGRCTMSHGRELCSAERPALLSVDEPGHRSACHFYGEVTLRPGLERAAVAVTDPAPAAPDRRRPVVDETADPVLAVTDLKKHFGVGRRLFGKAGKPVRAVDGVSFEVRAGETLGLVGESGSGKTTVGKALLGLVGDVQGSIAFLGSEVGGLRRSRLRAIRRDLQMVFQDPYGSLDPRMNVKHLIAEPMRIHGVRRAEVDGRVTDLLDRVGLPADYAERHAHQLSGGQRQRVGIARALALNPKVLVLDEPVSALDVSVQAQVINLLEEIQDEHGLAYIFIAHDLSVVHHVSDRVAIMYLGRIVEVGDRDAIYSRPTHPYTHALLSAVPRPDPEERKREGRVVLQGDIPSPSNPPSGCVFRTRCWLATEKCATTVPELTDRLGVGHPSACHYPEKVLALREPAVRPSR